MKIQFRPWIALSVAAGLSCGSEMAFAEPVSAWVAIFDGTNSDNYTIGSSLNDSGYLPPSDTNGSGAIGGGYASQTGAVLFDVQESTGVFGQVSAHFEYADSTPLANGAVNIVNFNIFGPDDPAGQISDTLSITITGHLDGTNNTSVDLHFLSDDDNGTSPSPLANAISIIETGQYQDVSSQIDAATGLSNFNLEFTSDVVPEPGTFVILAGGLLGMAAFRRLGKVSK